MIRVVCREEKSLTDHSDQGVYYYNLDCVILCQLFSQLLSKKKQVNQNIAEGLYISIYSYLAFLESIGPCALAIVKRRGANYSADNDTKIGGCKS